jgi:hypothetical protein
MFKLCCAYGDCVGMFVVEERRPEMITQVDRIKTAFFADEGQCVRNVKFFLGESRAVTAEQLADQLDRAEVQIRAGTAVRSRKLDGHLTTKTF